MLGFDALGRLALGQVPASTVTTVFISSRTSAMSRMRSAGSQSFVAQARIGASASLRAPMTPLGVMSARAKGQSSARAPGGLILKGKMEMMARANVTPGYLLFAKAMMTSSALSDIHIEGKTTTERNPLLLNSGSQFGASYWKGRN